MSDELVAPVWLFDTVILFRAAWMFARSLFPRDGMLLRVLHATLVSWACIVLAGIVLGACGCLCGASILLCVGCLSGILFWVGSVRHRMDHDRRTVLPDNRQPLRMKPNHFGQSNDTSDSERHDTTLESFSWDGWLILWSVLLALALGRIVLSGLLRFPANWDTLTYHLPLIVQWLKCGKPICTRGCTVGQPREQRTARFVDGGAFLR